MEISLEKIELVKDRTGVNYKEAKDALIRADGSVVDAIIMLEEEIDIAPKSKAGDQASQLVEAVKQLVKKGNVSKIVVKKEEETILNIPVNLGLIGAVWVFWPTVAAAVVALGMKCRIELVKDNGEVVCLSEKAAGTFSGVMDNCSVLADDFKEFGGEAFSQVKEKASEVINRVRSSSEEEEAFEDFQDFDDIEDIEDFDAADAVEESGPEKEVMMDSDAIQDDYDDDYFNFDDYEEPEDQPAADSDESVEEAAAAEPEAAQMPEEEAAESADEAPAESPTDEVREEIEKAGKDFSESMTKFKEKKGKFRFFN